MIIKLCAKCQKPIKYPDRFCTECNAIYLEEEAANEKIRNRRYYQTRDKKYLRFYQSPEWKLLKNKRMQDARYKCERCIEKGRNRLATEVHHMKPIQTEEGWPLRLDYNNLKCVCLDCHNFYHKRFQKKK